MWSCLRLWKPAQTPVNKKKAPSSRGPSGEVRSPPHRLRGARGAAVSQWLRSAPLQVSDWEKTGVWGLPGAFLVTFCAYKKLPGSGPGRPGNRSPKRLTSDMPPGPGRPRKNRAPGPQPRQKQKERSAHRWTSLYPSPVRPAASPYGRCAGPSSPPRPG